MAKKKVLSLWKVIMLVIGGIVGLLGATTLALYLMGELDEKHVEPAHIAFSEETVGSSYFDGTTSVAGVNGEVVVFKTSTNFQMTILSNTEGVTENEVTLSLSNQTSSRNGVLSNGIISVPEKVEIGKAFTVTLLPYSYSELATSGVESWIRGGTTLITAKSSVNVLLEPIYAQVKVDVPVYDLQIAVEGQEFGQEVNSVFVGTAFGLEEKFLPSESQKLFSQDGTKKEVFYSLTKAFIDYDWNYNKFVAKQKSGIDTDTITAYTFKNSYYQHKVLSQPEFTGLSYQDLTAKILEYANARDNFGQLIHDHEFVTAEIKIKVTDVEVGSVEFKDLSAGFSPYCNKYFTLTANSTLNGDGTLEAVVKDNDGLSVSSALSNLALKFPKLSEINSTATFKMLGGDVIKVVKDAQGEFVITKEAFEMTKFLDGTYFRTTVEAGDNAGCPVEYYLLPNTTPANAGNYNWQFAFDSTLNSKEIAISANFFFENQLGYLENFFEIEFEAETGGAQEGAGTENAKLQEISFKFKPKEKSYEENPSWTNDTIYITINYDGAGQPINASKNLEEDLNPINKDNLYQVVKYFLFVDEEAGNADDEDVLEVFKVKPGQVYAKDYLGENLVIDGAVTKNEGDGYRLYEIGGYDGKVLEVVKNYGGEVKVFVATIQTDVDGRPILDNGLYKIVKTSRTRAVVVESSLSIANMTPTFTVKDIEADENGDYFIPAINRDAEGKPEAIAEFRLVLSGENEGAGTGTDKLLIANQAGKLRVSCVDNVGNEINQYIVLQDLKFVETDEDVGHIYNAVFMVDEQYFRANPDVLDELGTKITLKLFYDDGNMVHSTPVNNSVEGKGYFYVYNQQPKTLTWDSMDKDKLVSEGGVKDVNVSLTTEGETISWGEQCLDKDREWLNDAFAFTIKDQKDKLIDLNLGIYGIKLVETPPTGQNALIALNGTGDQITGFNSTNGIEKSTTLQVFVVDADGNKVYVFDESGNATTDFLTPTEFNSITFNVRSEGVSHVFYYNQSNLDNIGNADAWKNPDFDATGAVDPEGQVDKEDFYDLGQNGNGKVEIYAVPNVVINLNDMLKVFVNGRFTNNLVFYLDSGYVAGLSATRQQDMMKMIAITADGVAPVAEPATEVLLSDFLGKAISAIKITNPFKDDTQIKFVVKDEEELLFEIELEIIFKADLRINNAFNTYNERYKDYLVSQDTAIGVFADETYALADFLTLTSTSDYTYTWEEYIGNYADLSDYIVGLDASIGTLANGTGVYSGKVVLTFNPIYSFKKVTFTIYFGAKSVYACSATISLYLNPNVVMEERVTDLSSVPYIDLSDTSFALNNYYNFYKFTGVDGYYQRRIESNGTPVALSFADANPADNKYDINYTFANQSGNAGYISWEYLAEQNYTPNANISLLYKFLFVQNEGEVAKTLSLSLGGKIRQSFNVTNSAVLQDKVALIKIKVVDGQDASQEENRRVELYNVGNVTLEFNLGYGDEDSQVVESGMLSRWYDENSDGDYAHAGSCDANCEHTKEMLTVPTVIYNGEMRVVLVKDEKYVPQSFDLKGDPQGYLQELSGKLEVSGGAPLVGYVGNSFEVGRELQTNSTKLNINILINAVVTTVGENFVYYQPFEMNDGVKEYAGIDSDKDKIFNNYADVELQDLIGDYANDGENAYKALEENDVYQTLTAGATYNVLHLYNVNDDLKEDDKFGLYVLGKAVFNADKTGFGANKISLSIVENAEGYISGLAELKEFENADYAGANWADSSKLYNKIKINHLEQAYDEAYIVLKLEISEYQNPNNRFVMFYRIKVKPSFQSGMASYPYAQDAEYLDHNSKYYKYDNVEENYYYEINLEEELDLDNSKYIGGEKRFKGCLAINGATLGTLSQVYTISSVYVDGVRILTSQYDDYFDFNRNEEGSLQLASKDFKIYLKDQTTKLTVHLSRKVMSDGSLMIGSESDYIFKFNQSDTYVLAVKQKLGEGAYQTLIKSENRFASNITAGDEDETTYSVTIKKSQGGVTTPVESLTSKFVGTDETELQNYLMAQSVYAKAGTTLYKNNSGELAEDENGNAIKLAEVVTLAEFDWISVTTKVGELEEYIAVPDTEYFVKKTDVSWGFASWGTLGEDYILKLKPMASISQDKTFEIEFFTEQLPAFYIDLNVKSYFTKTQGMFEVAGGKEYYLMTGDRGTPATEVKGIFDEISSSKQGEKPIQSIVISLKDDENLDGVVDVGGGQHFVKEFGTTTLTYKDIVKINNVAGEDGWKNSTITFANLPTDVTFDFIGTINDGSNYTFEFSITAKASYEEKTRTFTDNVDRFGGKDFEIEGATVVERFADLAGFSNLTTYGIKSIEMQSDDEKASNASDIDGNGRTGEYKVTPENVTSTTGRTIKIVFACKFDNVEIFDFEVVYSYTVKKNVELGQNYPKADGETESEVEYVATTKDGEIYKSAEIEGFFTNTSLNNKDEDVEPEDEYKDNARIGVEMLGGCSVLNTKWDISIANISNAIVRIGGNEYKEVGAEICEGMSLEDVKALNLMFTLVSDSANGQVEFNVVVNKVPTTYKVIIVKGGVFTISTNAPNYANNHETIYAEDYAELESGNIFEDGRILSYKFVENASKSATYVARFEKPDDPTDFKTFALDASKAGTQMNIDLGVSGLSGYKYAGTYMSDYYAQNKVSDAKYVDASTFETNPKLTGRLEATYRDGTPLKVDETNTFIYLTATKPTAGHVVDDNNKQQAVSLSASDYGTEKTYCVSIYTGGELHVTDYTYKVLLDIKFAMMGGVESDSTYPIIELQADKSNPKTLLSLASSNNVRLYNPVTNQTYTEDALASLSGQISLKIYGFDDLEIVDCGDDDDRASMTEECRLTDIAYSIHNKLMSTENEGIVYSTGLTPRIYEGFDLNDSASIGTVANNYIAIAGLRADEKDEKSKIVDYNIFAQGANNDGNHVMMRLTYSVDVAGSKIEKHFNLLFKVLPNSNLSFRNKINETGFTNAGAEIVGNQTIASNHENPFQVDTSIVSGVNTIYLCGIDDAEDGKETYEMEVVRANMYGDSSNEANGTFDYTYVLNKLAGYNQSGAGTLSGKEFEFNPITLGEKKFVIEMENSFGYKARFYFRIFSELNPTIVSATSSSLKEGEFINFASTYQEVVMGAGGVAEESFTFNYHEGDKTVKSFSLQGVYRFKLIVEFNGKQTIDDGLTAYGVSLGSMVDDEDPDTSPNYISDVVTLSGCGDVETTIELKNNENWTYEHPSGGDIHVAFKAVNPWGYADGNSGQEDWNGFDLSIIKSFTFTVVEHFENSTGYSFKLNYSDNTHEFIGPTATVSPDIKTPTNTGEGTKTFVLGGTQAIAFNGGVNDKFKADTDENKKLHSYVTDMTITGVKFVANGKTVEATGVGSKKIITTNGEKEGEGEGAPVKQRFISEINNTVYRGVAYSATDCDIKVPYFDGIAYGTSSFINNVEMIVTLDLAGVATCEVSRMVTINREANHGELFVNKTIRDGYAPQLNTAQNTTNHVGNVYNDTLEVTLKPGANISVAVSNSSDFSKQHLTTFTNNNEFEIKQYVSITQNIVGLSQNLSDEDGNKQFNIAVIDNNSTDNGGTAGSGYAIEYNNSALLSQSAGESITTDETTFANGKVEKSRTVSGVIGVYSADTSGLDLHINHVSELNSSNQKVERLYFLFTHNSWNNTSKKGENYYQHTQAFTVVPEYLEAKSHLNTNNNDESFDDYIEIDEYYELKNESNSHYIIEADVWGNLVWLYNKEVNITNKQNAQRFATALATGANVDTYKFTFEIDTSLGGSAVIDEKGMITTASNFEISDQLIFVNMYMKVSGSNGMFEQDNAKIKLAQFKLALKKIASGQKFDDITDKKVYGYPNNINNIFVVPEDYEFYYYGTGSWADYQNRMKDGEKTMPTTNSGTFAYQLGTTLTKNDFESILASKLTGTYGRNYHVVAEKLNVGQANETTTYRHYNNLNNYTITTSGTHEIYVIATYIDGTEIVSGTLAKKNAVFKITLVAYDTAVTETLVRSCAKDDGNDGTVDDKIVLDNSWTWYEITNSGVAPKTTYSHTEAGVHDVQYIAFKGNNSKIVNATFYVYDETKTEDVLIKANNEYQLVNMLDSADKELKNIKFFNVDGSGIMSATTSTSSNSLNGSATKEYIMVGVNNSGNKVVKKYTTTFHTVSNETDATMVVKKNVNIFDSLCEEIDGLTTKEVDKTNDSLFVVDGFGVMTEITTPLTLDKNFDEKKIVWKDVDDGNKLYVFNFDFYTYTDKQAGVQDTIEVYVSGTSTTFGLSNCNEAVKLWLTANGVTGHEDKSVSYYYLNANGEMTPMQRVDTTEGVVGGVKEINDCYIKVGDDLYLYVTLKIAISAS